MAICTPAYDGRAHLSFYLGVNEIRRAFESVGVESSFMHTGQSANLPRLRNSLVAFAFDWGADAILWVDSDIAGSGADALRLWNSGKEIIAAAPQRRPSSLDDAPSVAFRPLEGGQMKFDGVCVEVGAVATAFCLTRRSVFEKMKEAGEAKLLKNPDCPQSDWFRNWFWYELVEVDGGYIDEGEDYYFCRKATALGVQCFIEPTVRPIHHEGNLKLPANFWDVHGALFSGQNQ